jgi:hypothetical protein
MPFFNKNPQKTAKKTLLAFFMRPNAIDGQDAENIAGSGSSPQDNIKHLRLSNI